MEMCRGEPIGKQENAGEPDGPGSVPDRKVQLVEACVFLSLIVPSMVLSLFVVRRANPPFVLVAVSAIVRDAGFLALILFLLWRNGESLRRIGLSGRGGWREAVLGLGLYVPFFITVSLLGGGLRAAGFSAPTSIPGFLTPKDPAQLLLGVLLVAVVAVVEEIIFRGYLILRLRAVTGSVRAAVLLSSLIFAIGHGYEGSAGIVVVFSMGVIFALIYVWRQSLTAPMVMHFLQDFIGIVALPLLGLR
jgi:membrane protease YdiL (CAAX protease family)